MATDDPCQSLAARRIACRNRDPPQAAAAKLVKHQHDHLRRADQQRRDIFQAAEQVARRLHRSRRKRHWPLGDSRIRTNILGRPIGVLHQAFELAADTARIAGQSMSGFKLSEDI